MKLTSLSAENKVEEITYKGEVGFFIPPDMLKFYHDLKVNVVPKLKEDVKTLENWIDKRKEVFNESIERYGKIKRQLIFWIPFGCINLGITIVVITGVIFYSFYRPK